MNKKFLSGILCGALLIASASTFVSCKDYDDDIKNLQEQIDQDEKGTAAQYADLAQTVKDNKEAAEKQMSELSTQIKEAETAYQEADATLKKLIEDEAAARLAADNAAKAYTDAEVAAAKNYTDAAKAEALEAAKQAKEAAEKFADEAAAALAKAEANAAATYATKVELENARKALQEGVDKAQADATDALEKYAQLTEDLKTLEDKLTLAYQQADENLKTQLQDEITDVNDQLTEEVKKLTAADTELEKQIAAANKLIEQANKNIEDLQTTTKTLQDDLKELEDVTIPTVKKGLEAADKKLEESIAALEKKEGEDVVALQNSLNELKEALALTDKAVVQLQADLTALQETVASLNQRVADMSTAIVAVKNDLAAHLVIFNAFVAETDDNFLTVWDSVAGLDARCTDIEAKAAELEKSLNETKQALDDLSKKEAKDVTDLLQKIADEKAAIIKKMGEDIAAAKEELTNAYKAADAILKAAYEAADKALENKISQEIYDRQQAIANEAQAREQADNTEAQTRKENDDALGVRIDDVITAYKEADTKIQKQLDDFYAEYQDYVVETDKRLAAAEAEIIRINSELSKVKNDLYELITSIVYQSSDATGSWAADPVVKDDEPVIYYCTQTADHAAWPSATVKNHAPEIHQGEDVFQYQSGHFYATVNPSNVDMTGLTLDLENSNGEKSLFFEFGALEASTKLITKGTAATGLYQMDLLPAAGFNYDQIKNDKVLYAMAANWQNAQGQNVKVSGTYGLDNFENYCEIYPSARPGKVAKPKFKFYTDATYTQPQSQNDMFADFEYQGETTTSLPTAYLQLDEKVAQWNYKWYIEFFEYNDNDWKPGDPIDHTKYNADKNIASDLFKDYVDEALDSVTYNKSFELKDGKYINKRILVRVRAINYDYKPEVYCTILSFTRPLFDDLKLTNTFYPGNKTTQNLYFAQQLKDSLGTEGVAKYEEYAAANGEIATVDPIATGMTAPSILNPITLDGFDGFTYDPEAIAYSPYELEDNKATVAIQDKAKHDIIKVELNAQIKTPYHLDTYVMKDGVAQNRIPASFGFKHDVKVGDETKTIQLYDEAYNKDMILVWPSVTPVVYDFKGAFVKTATYVPEATTDLGSTPWFIGDWKASNNSIFFFRSKSSDLTVNNSIFTPTVTVNNNVKSMSIFANKDLNVNSQISDYIFTKNELRPYALSRCIKYYESVQYYSAAADTFYMTFASPINYGIYRAASDVKAGETFTIEYSLVKGANKITFDDIFPDYSVITSGDPKTFGLTDSRIAGSAGDDNVQITVYQNEIPEYTFLEGLATNPIKSREITFNYSNTAAISAFTLPCEMKVTDIWGISTSIKFNLKFLPNKL